MRVPARLILGLVATGGLAPAQAQGFAKVADFERWAAARAVLTDKVSILYLTWGCANEGQNEVQSVSLREWRRAPEGECVTQWPPSEDLKAWLPPHANAPCSWTSDQLDALGQRALDLAKTPPSGYTCFQQGRYANWSYRDRLGSWFGELTLDGDACTIRDQLHMALGLTFVGDWFLPDPRAHFDVALNGGIEAVLTSKDERIAFMFDSDRRVLRSRDDFRARSSTRSHLLLVREGPTGLGVDGPRVVSFPPGSPRFMFAHSFAVRYERIRSLPQTMLQTPPVDAAVEPRIGSLIDRRFDRRAGGLRDASNRQAEQAEEEARRAKKGK